MTATKVPALLAAFNGAKPPAPPWFEQAIAHQPARLTITVEGAALELLTWGDVGKPGLLLLHGGMAHADWWRFIAPFFATTHRVAALSWSGMGNSEWRPRYAVEQYVREMFAAITAAGLDKGPGKPIVLAHSFGGFPTMRAACTRGHELGGAIILDAPVLTPQQRADRDARRKVDPPPRETRIYPSEAEALARFRFSPAQACANLFIVDWIARSSLRRAAGADGTLGWTWKFDPFLWSRLERTEGAEDLANAACRVAVVWGGTSVLFKPETIDYVRSVAPNNALLMGIPEAAHHVMADQPLALVATMRAILGTWG